MKIRTFPAMALWALITCPLAAQTEVEAPAAPPAESTAPAQEIQAKQTELARLGEEISTIEKQAQQNETVQQTMEQFRDTVAQAIVQEAPELEPQIKRQSELVDELTAEGAEETELAKREQKLAEYKELRQKIEPIERQVQNAEAVQQARDTYYGTLIAAMRKINPRADELIEQHKQLTNELKQLQQRS